MPPPVQVLPQPMAPQGSVAGAMRCFPTLGEFWPQPQQLQQQQQRPGQQQQQQQRPAVPWAKNKRSPSTGGQRSKPTGRAAALTKQAAQLEEIGGCEDMVQELRQQAEQARAQEKETKPYGQRLDEAEGRLDTAYGGVEKATTAVRAAWDNYEKALKEAQTAETAVREIRAAREPASVAGEKLATTAGALMAWLEGHTFGVEGRQGPPEQLATLMNQVQECLETRTAAPEAAQQGEEGEEAPEDADAAMGEVISSGSEVDYGAAAGEEVPLPQTPLAATKREVSPTQQFDHPLTRPVAAKRELPSDEEFPPGQQSPLRNRSRTPPPILSAAEVKRVKTLREPNGA